MKAFVVFGLLASVSMPSNDYYSGHRPSEGDTEGRLFVSI
jgi:hypothetical protein